MQSHAIVSQEQSLQHDPRKRQKMKNIHQEIEDSLTSFRKKFATIISDMKYLVDDEAARKGIEKVARELESKVHDPLVEDEIAKDLASLQNICAPQSADQTGQNIPDTNPNKMPRHPNDSIEDPPAT